MYNLLTDCLIRMDMSDGFRVEATLPEVYAALMADQVEAFAALRPHQRHAWHAFLVQLGTMAMHRANRGEPPGDSETWTSLIRGLTPDFPGDEPWQLVVDDITAPAFMQPPASSSDKAAEYKGVIETADELDMLVTSKNHDLKAAVAVQASVDDWIFALITLQTMAGFSGAGNYGISRMNGGLGSRPAFALAPASGRTGAHVRRDIVALLESLPDFPDLYVTTGDAALLWALSWNGTPAEALLSSHLAPLYIEVCRRVRLLSGAESQLHAVRTSSGAARIEAKALKGKTGDPWTPVDREASKSLTLAAGGFTYKRMVDYLIKWEQPILCKPTGEEVRSSDTMQLVARGMVRGQGKTEGYYERTIPIRKKLKSAIMRGGPETDDLGHIANERIEHIGKVQRILSHSIQVFLARGDTDKLSQQHRNRARPWLYQLDEIIDERFFEALQDEFDAGDLKERERIRNRWLANGTDGVVDHARRIRDDAMDSLPCPEIERYKARVAAEGLFEGRIRGNSGLPFLFDQERREVKE